MQTGFVFKLDPSCPAFWGILSYYPNTEVRVRVIDTNSVYRACEELGREFAGDFRPADSDQIAWGRVVFKARGSAEILANV